MSLAFPFGSCELDVAGLSFLTRFLLPFFRGGRGWLLLHRSRGLLPHYARALRFPTLRLRVGPIIFRSLRKGSVAFIGTSMASSTDNRLSFTQSRPIFWCAWPQKRPLKRRKPFSIQSRYPLITKEYLHPPLNDKLVFYHQKVGKSSVTSHPYHPMLITMFGGPLVGDCSQ